MNFIDKLRDIWNAEEDEGKGYGDDPEEEIPKEQDKRFYQTSLRKPYMFTASTEPMQKQKREPQREPYRYEYKREDESNISLHSRELYKEHISKFKIIIFEPKSYDDSPKVVDLLKKNSPVIINLEKVQYETAKKIFNYLLGAICALNGKAQEVTRYVYLFLPENVDVQSSSDKQSYKYGER